MNDRNDHEGLDKIVSQRHAREGSDDVTPLEQEVLDEYARLAGNMDKVSLKKNVSASYLLAFLVTSSKSDLFKVFEKAALARWSLFLPLNSSTLLRIMELVLYLLYLEALKV